MITITPIKGLEILKAIEDRIDLDDAKKALADVKKHGSTSLETIKRKFKLTSSASSRTSEGN